MSPEPRTGEGVYVGYARRRAALHAGCFTAALWLSAATASPSHAHLAKSTSTLRSLIAESDLVIRARVQKLDTFVAPDGPDEMRRSVLRVEVLEVLKGPDVSGKSLAVSQHGHGVVKYRPGEEALLFLRHLSKSRELHKLASTGELEWLSTQEHDEAYALSPDARRATLQAARRYVSIEKMAGDERVQALRRITVKLLGSRDPQPGASALRDLVLAPGLPLVTREDVPALRKGIHDPKLSIGLRVGLLIELDRRGLLDPDPEWIRLLRTSNGKEQIAVIRGAGSHPSALVNAALFELLAAQASETAAAAAIALGSPGNVSAVEPLSEALASKDKRVAMASIRGLGVIGNPDARAALASAAESHSDASVRRRAAAELRILDAHNR